MKITSYIFLFYVGFYFYRLAEIHKRNKWLFVFIGITAFFTGYYSYILYFNYFLLKEINEFNMALVSLKSFIAGLIFVFVLFQSLSLVWSRKKKMKNHIDSIGKTDD